MSVVKEAVEDRVGIGGISYGVMPRGRGKLAGDDGRLATVAILGAAEAAKIRRSAVSGRRGPPSRLSALSTRLCHFARTPSLAPRWVRFRAQMLFHHLTVAPAKSGCLEET